MKNFDTEAAETQRHRGNCASLCLCVSVLSVVYLSLIPMKFASTTILHRGSALKKIFMHSRNYLVLIACLTVAIHFLAATTKGEDGYRLWLRYDPLPRQIAENYRLHVTSVVVPGQSATLDAIRTELINGCSGLLGNSIP